MYMDDIKLFARNENGLDILIQTVRLYSDDIGMEFSTKNVFNDTRKHCFRENTMKDLFENVHMNNVLSFLKETGLHQKIWTWLQSWKHNK